MYTSFGNDPLYFIYFWNNRQPKGVVRPTAGHLVSLMWTMKNFYGADEDDIFWAASDVGWVMGHSYIVYAIFAGNTTFLFEGKPLEHQILELFGE